MAKSPLERQLEAQMKQEKQLANKQKREGERRAREQKKMEREAMIRERAASIVMPTLKPLLPAFGARKQQRSRQILTAQRKM